MKARPAPGWLLVEKLDTVDTVGTGVILIPQQTKERLTRWQYTVVASGGPPLPEIREDGKRVRPKTYRAFQPGDWVICPPRSVTDVDEEGLLLLPLESCWAVVE